MDFSKINAESEVNKAFMLVYLARWTRLTELLSNYKDAHRLWLLFQEEFGVFSNSLKEHVNSICLPLWQKWTKLALQAIEKASTLEELEEVQTYCPSLKLGGHKKADLQEDLYPSETWAMSRAKWDKLALQAIEKASSLEELYAVDKRRARFSTEVLQTGYRKRANVVESRLRSATKASDVLEVWGELKDDDQASFGNAVVLRYMELNPPAQKVREFCNKMRSTHELATKLLETCTTLAPCIKAYSALQDHKQERARLCTKMLKLCTTVLEAEDVFYATVEGSDDRRKAAKKWLGLCSSPEQCAEVYRLMPDLQQA